MRLSITYSHIWFRPNVASSPDQKLWICGFWHLIWKQLNFSKNEQYCLDGDLVFVSNDLHLNTSWIWIFAAALPRQIWIENYYIHIALKRTQKFVQGTYTAVRWNLPIFFIANSKITKYFKLSRSGLLLSNHKIAIT